MPVNLRVYNWVEVLPRMAQDGWLYKVSNNDPIDHRETQSAYCSFWKYINNRYVGAYSSKDAGDEHAAVFEAAKRALEEEERYYQGL